MPWYMRSPPTESCFFWFIISMPIHSRQPDCRAALTGASGIAGSHSDGSDVTVATYHRPPPAVSCEKPSENRESARHHPSLTCQPPTHLPDFPLPCSPFKQALYVAMQSTRAEIIALTTLVPVFLLILVGRGYLACLYTCPLVVLPALARAL